MILTEGGQISHLPAAESLSQTDQQQERSDAPGNPEHGQERA
jgi:hypothetical protein